MDRVGRTTAMTVVSTVPWWWVWWLHVFWAYANLRRNLAPRRSKKSQRMLSVASILFAHWSVLTRTPPGRSRRASKRFPHRWSYLIFQSNFNGTRDLYLEVFSVAVLWRMRAIWRGAYGAPDLLPLTRFQEYVATQDIAPSHYYCAYPEASTKIVAAALDLQKEFDGFASRSADLEAPEFKQAYDEFLKRSHAFL